MYTSLAIAKPHVGDIKQCNASNAFFPGNMPVPTFQKNTWTHSMLAPPSLYRTHPTAGEECPPLLAIMIQA